VAGDGKAEDCAESREELRRELQFWQLALSSFDII
jgi:hypothetical protein